MALKPGRFFEKDLCEWLSSWRSTVNVNPERVDLDALIRDLLAHTDPLLGEQGRRNPPTSTGTRKMGSWSPAPT